MKNKLTYLFLAAIFAFIIPFAAVGCQKGDKVIKINEVTHSVFYAPLYAADALGYFGDEGFKIELTNGGGADATMAAVLSGAADIGFCGPEAVIYVALGGSDDCPKVFGQLTKRDGSFLVGRNPEPDFKWSNLEGKNILAGRKGGVPAMTFEYVLKQEKVNATLNFDVAFNMMTAAFESGISDYCTMFEPTASEYQAAGKGYIVAAVGEAGGEVPYTAFSAKKSWLKKHDDETKGFLRAMLKAVKYAQEKTPEEIAPSLVSHFPSTSVESLAASIRSYQGIDAWKTDMAMTEASFDRLQDIIESAGELQQRGDFTALVDNSYVKYVYQNL